MTGKEAYALVAQLKTVFDIVRLVDVSMTTQYTPDGEGVLTPGKYQCYAVWNKSGRCENCISAKAFAQKTRLTKYEFIGPDVYYVVAKYLEVDGAPYVLEIVSNVTDEVLFGAVGKAHLVEAIQERNKHLYQDALTGAYNRAYYEEQLQALIHAHAIAMMDVDQFKQINDTYGHQAGDQALRTIVHTLQKNMRGADAVIRYGGDEFLLAFRGMQEKAFADKLESLRRIIGQTPVAGYPGLRLSVSIGGCSGHEEGEDPVRVADQRLYQAKKTRNAVCCE